jgi:CBS domain-containing protein
MQAFWGSAIELDDGMDGASVVSGSSVGTRLGGRRGAPSVAPSASPSRSKAVAAVDEKPSRPVSSLRPSKAIVVSQDASVFEACERMSKRRSNAVLVVGGNGVLCGILTGTDVSRRVLGKGLDPNTTPVSQVMTRNPSCVQSSDGAMDALLQMVEGRFRHLPVLGDKGDIAGVLDIAKCLYVAISRLERAQEKLGSSKADAVTQLSYLASSGGGLDLNSLEDLLSSIKAKTSPTLGSVLSSVDGADNAIVDASATVLEATELMVSLRVSALLVLEGNEVLGLLTTDNILNYLVSEGLVADETCVSDVMTPSPDMAPSETTILEALHLMHGEPVHFFNF